jgi:purine-nucleoside phosphorylase
MGEWEKRGIGESEREESILRPYLIRDRALMRETAIFIPFQFSIKKVLSFVPEHARIKAAKFGIFNLVTLEDKVIMGPALGAPSAVILLEELIGLGVRNVITFGICGSLHETVRIGDILVPTAAYSEEGTSKHYAPGTSLFPANAQLTEEIKAFLTQARLRCVEATLVSTDAPYRETPSLVKKYQGCGVSAIDMELSAIYALALFRRVRAAAIMVVSDELFTYRWRPGLRSPTFNTTLTDVAKGLVSL